MISVDMFAPLRKLIIGSLIGLMALLACQIAISAAEDDPFPMPFSSQCSPIWRDGTPVFFKENTTEIQGHGDLQPFIDAWRLDGGPILLDGHIDIDETSGQSDLSLDLYRANFIAQKLMDAGLPRGIIWTRGRGTASPAAPKPRSEQDHFANRRVVMMLPLSGQSCLRTVRTKMFDWLRRNCSEQNKNPNCWWALKEFERYL